MKKITMLILLMVCAIGYSQTDAESMGVNNPVTIKQQKKTQTVQLPQNEVTYRGASATDLGINDSQPRNSNVQSWASAPAPVVSSSLLFGTDVQEEILANQLAMANQPVNFNVSPQNYGNRNPQADIIPTAGATETFNPAIGDHFFDPGGPGGGADGTPGNYPNCGCDTQSTLAGVTEIEFIDFGIFATFDYLRIYDGTDATGTLLYDNGSGGPNSGDNTLADMIASHGSSTFTSASGNFFFFFHSSTVVNRLGWDVEILSTGGGGGGACANAVLEVNQDVDDTCMANISQGGLAQSYIPTEASSAGAGVKFRDPSSGLDVNLSLWDGLPNAGGTMLASGTSQTDGTNWADVFWDPVVSVTVGTTYYIVIDGDITLPCISGSTNNPYPGGNVFANNYGSFPTFDYTFRTYSCDGGGGGGCTPGDLQTLFAGGNNGSPGGAVYFDMTVGAEDIEIDSFDMNTAQTGPFTMDVYVFEGTYVGNQGNPAPWGAAVATGSGTGAGVGLPSTATLDVPVTMSAGTTYAVALVFDATHSHTYTNGDGTNQNYSNGDITLDLGSASNVPFTNPIFDPRVWNGSVGYCVGGGGGGTCVSTAYDSTAVPFDIDGAGTSTADCTNAPNLIPVTVADAGTIGSGANLENITIDITHTWSGDLDLYLVSPAGTELLLAESLSGNTDNAYNGTMFEDGGADISTAPAPFGVGPYEPMGGTFAAAFAGEDITGDWNLKVCDGAGGDTGQVLQFSMSICVPPVITNDDCSNAYALACGDSVTGETLTATDSGGNAAPDVFYKFTGTGSPQLVTISLCAATDYDSYLRVFDDCDLANELAANDDFCGLQSQVTFQSDGTSTYYIMVEGFGSGAGNFSLDVTCMDPLPNDGCEGAIAVSCGDSVTGSTDGATIDTAPTCGTPITSPGVWYTLDDNSGLPGDITLSLCNGTDFDSKISVYSGSCAALVCVDGNDDACGLQSEISFASDGNTTYYILIHGFGGATGNFTLDVTCIPTPPPNDMIVNSIDVDEIGFPYTDPSVAMPAATTENGSPAGCDLTGANGVWYNFVAAGDGTANAMIVTPGGASSVTFYTAPNENSVETDLTLVPQQTNQCLPGTSASIFTLAGQAYYVFVLNNGAITDIVIDGTNLGTADNTIAGFSYYPNPTTGVLNLKSVDNIERVSIYSLLGQMVLDSRVDATTSQLDVSALSTGSYLMKVTVNGQTGTYKVLKD